MKCHMQTVYSYLLQEPSESFSETVDYLYDLRGTGPVDKALDIYNECRQKIHDVIYAYLPFDLNVGDVDDIPAVLKELDNEIRNKVLDDYQQFIDRFDIRDMIRDAEESILRRIECRVWNRGLKDLPEVIDAVMAGLADCAGQYARMQSSADPSALDGSLEKAAKVTFMEKLLDSNVDDVMIYRQNMIEYLEKMCSNRMYEFFERFFSILSCSSLLTDVRNRLSDVRDCLANGCACGQDILLQDVVERYEEVRKPVFTDMLLTGPEEVLAVFVGLLQKND